MSSTGLRDADACEAARRPDEQLADIALRSNNSLVKSALQRPKPVPPMSDESSGGVLTFGAFDVVVFAAIVYLVTKLVRRVTGVPTERPKIA